MIKEERRLRKKEEKVKGGKSMVMGEQKSSEVPIKN